MKSKKKVILEPEKSIKSESIYVRIDHELSKKISGLQGKPGFKNKSQVIRAILEWSFKNGL